MCITAPRAAGAVKTPKIHREKNQRILLGVLMNESSQGVLWLNFPKKKTMFFGGVGGCPFFFVFAILPLNLIHMDSFTEKTWHGDNL